MGAVSLIKKLVGAVGPVAESLLGKRRQQRTASLSLETLETRQMLSAVAPEPWALGTATANDIVLDANGTLHVAYHDNATQSLAYASRSEWGTWTATTIVPGTANGQSPSIAIDPTDGRPAIAYYDATAQDLKYAKYNGSTWVVSTPAATAGVNDGQYASLAFVAAGPVVSYYNVTSGDLKVASSSGGTWTSATFDSTGDVGRYSSLVVTNYSAGLYSVAYADVTNNALRYYEKNASPVQVAAVSAPVQHISLALNPSGQPAIAYYRAGGYEDLYLVSRPASWGSPELVASTGNQGAYANLFYSADGTANIAYHDQTNNQVKISRKAVGGSWKWYPVMLDGGTQLQAVGLSSGQIAFAAQRSTDGVTVVDDSSDSTWVEALEYVYNNIEYTPYAGSMKGADATRDSGSGNDWDQASLLIQLLRQMGVSAQYKHGRVSASASRVMEWLGVADGTAAIDVLALAGMNPSVNGSDITFDHVWVVANVPGNGTSLETKEMDPSWKFKDLQAGFAGLDQVVPVNTPDQRMDTADLALLRPATAVAGSGYAGSLAVDGNLSTQWRSLSTGNQTFTVDLGATFNVSRVKLLWGTGYATGYNIRLSNDNASYPVVQTVSAGNGEWDDITLATPLHARYVRIECIAASAGAAHYALSDLAVYGLDNLARGRTATASTGPSPSNVTDGNFSTMWSTTSTTGSIQVDLGAVRAVNGLALRWGSDYATQYTLDVSDDNSTWRTLRTISTGLGLGDGDLDTISGLTGSGQYVRVSWTQTNGSGVSLSEFEICDTPRTKETPLEAYERRVAAYLAVNYPGIGLADIPYDGQLLAKQFAAGSVSLPSDYTVVGTPVVSATVPQEKVHSVQLTLSTEAWALREMAAGSTAAAASEYSATYNASKAIDGSSTTWWSSANGTADVYQWFRLDMGRTIEANRVKFIWASGNGMMSSSVYMTDDPNGGTGINWVAAGATYAGTTLDYQNLSASGRYLFITGSGHVWTGQPCYSIDGLQVYTTDQAAGSTAAAASEYSATFSPSKAIDGSSTTWWSSANGTADVYQWFRLDMGKTIEANRVKFIWASGNGMMSSSVFMTDDPNGGTGINWVAAGATYAGTTLDYQNLSASGRYLFIIGSGHVWTGQPCYSIDGLQVYTTDQTVWSTAYGSTEYSATYNASKAIDGSSTTWWSSGNGTASTYQYFRLDFGKTIDVNRVRFNWGPGNAMASYNISVAADPYGSVDNQWLVLGATGTGAAVDYLNLSGSGRYLFIGGSGAVWQGQPCYSIDGLQVYSNQMLLQQTLDVPAVADDGVGISYAPADSTSAVLIPQLRVGGQTVATGVALGAGRNVTLRLDVLNGNKSIGTSKTIDDTFYFGRAAGQALGLALDAGQNSDVMLQKWQAELNAQALVIEGMTGAESDYGEKLRTYQNGLLTLAGSRYYHRYRESVEQIGALLGSHSMGAWGTLSRGQCSMGLVTGDPLQWEGLYPITSKTQFDLPGSIADPVAPSPSVLRLHGQQMSVLESAVLEELLNAESISTWKGLEWAYQNGKQIKVIPRNDPNVVTITNALQVGAAQKAAILRDVQAGYDVTVPDATIAMAQWTGAVWAAEGGDYSSSWMIMANGETQAHGGSQAGPVSSPAPFVPNKGFDLYTGDPVSVSSGSMTHDEEDFSIANLGFPLAFARHYDSLSGDDWNAGIGWRFTFGDRLNVEGTKVTWQAGNGENHTFTDIGGGSYTRPPQLYGTLTSDAVKYLYRQPDGTEYHFDKTSGRLTQILDRYGNGVIITNGTYGPTQVKDAKDAARSVTFSYPSGRLESVSDFTGRTWSFGYTSMIQPDSNPPETQYFLAAATSPSDAQTQQQRMEYGYYSGSLLHGLMHTIHTKTDGGTHTFEYYPNRKAFRVTDSENRQEAFFYDSYHLVTEHTDSRGYTTAYQFKDDGRGLTAAIINPDHTRTSNEWNEFQLAAVTDELGRRETFQYNGSGYVTEHVAKDGVPTTYTYETTNTGPTITLGVKAVTLPGDRTTTYTYSDRTATGSLVSIQDALGKVTTFTYPVSDNRGLPSSRTAPNGNDPEWSSIGSFTTDFTYNQAGQVLTQTAHPSTGNVVTAYTYTTRGFLLTQTDPTNIVTTNTYNLLGDMLSSSLPDPDGAGPLGALTSSYTYDRGLPSSMTDPNGSVSRQVYDRMERLWKVTHADGSTIRTTYDALGNPLQTVDELGRRTLFVYDSRGRRVQTVFPDNTAQRVRYDSAGRVVTTIDERGNATRTSYDAGDRVTGTTDALGQVVSLRYNEVGQLVETRDWATFADEQARPYLSVATIVAIADTDGDGNADEIRYNSATGAVEIIDSAELSVALYTFNDSYPTAWRIVGIGDIDGNYTDDLVWLNTVSGANQVWFMSGPSIASSGSIGAPVTGAQPAGVGDLNADGFADLLWHKSSTGENWLAMTNPGSPLSWTPIAASFSGAPAAIGDFNGDGFADIAMRNSGTGVVTVYRVHHGLSFTSIAMPFAVGSNEQVAAVADLDGDGADDLVWQDSVSGQARVWLMSKTHANPTNISLMSHATRRIRGAGDYDGDGHPDFAWTDASAGASGAWILGGMTRYELDKLGRVTETRGPGGLVSTTDYDATGNVVEQVRYDVTYLSDIPDDPRNIADTSLHRVVETEFDVLDRPIQVINPDGTSTFATYDKAGRMLTSTDELGRTTTFHYDAAGRMDSKTLPDPDGAGPLAAPVFTYTYDANGNTLSVTNTTTSPNQVTKYTYDSRNRKTGEYVMESTVRTVSLSRSGSTVTVTSTNHGYSTGDVVEIRGATQKEYNGFFTIFVTGVSTFTYTITDTPAAATGTIQAERAVSSARYQYDAAGNLTARTDALGQTTNYAYTSRNRVETETLPDPDGAGPAARPVISYGYDAAGNRISVTDARNNVTSYAYDALNRVTLTVAPDPDGAGSQQAPATWHKYLFNQVVEITDPLNNVSSYTYDSAGRKIAETSPDPDGGGPLSSSVTRYGYDALGNLTGVMDPRGGVTFYTYDNRNRKLSEIQPDPDGDAGPQQQPVILYGYDAAGNLVKVTDPTGRITKSSYDGLNRKTGDYSMSGTALAVALSRSGSTVTVTVAGHGFVTGEVVEIRGANQPEYNGFFVISVTGANAFTYTIAGTPATATGTILAEKAVQSSRYEYDAAGNRTGVYDGLNYKTTSTYDALNRKTQETLPDPDYNGPQNPGTDANGPLTAPVTSYTYDANGNVKTVTDPDGRITQYTYDALNRKTGAFQLDMAANAKSISSITRSGGTTAIVTTGSSHGYQTGEVVRISGANQPQYNGFFVITVTGATTFTYSMVSDPGASASAAPGQTLSALKSLESVRYEYDAAGNRTGVYDGLNYKTTYTYDNLNRKTQETLPDPDNNAWQNPGPDANGPLTAPVTSYTYDANGNLKTLTDPNSNVTSFTYDALNRAVLATQTQLSVSDATTFDANGNVQSMTDRNGQRTYFVYDALNRVTKEHWLASAVTVASITSAVVNGIHTATVTTSSAHGYQTGDWVEIAGIDQALYNGLFQITYVNSTTFKYTASVLPTTSATGTTKQARKSTRVTSSTYDAAGRLLTISDPDSSYAYTYDVAGRVQTISNSGTSSLPVVVLTIGYDAAGRRSSVSSSVNGSGDFVNSFLYDAIGRLGSVRQAGTNVQEKRVDVAYTNAGQQQSFTRYSDVGGTARTSYSEYGYDSAGRLTALVHRNNGGAALVSYGWTYDGQGRLLSFTQPEGSVSYKYDASGQLTLTDYSWRTDDTYSYDAAGNRTMSGYVTGSDNRVSSDGTYTYLYDNEGNRTRATRISDSSYVQYTYDHRNRLTHLAYRTGGGTLTKQVQYVYDSGNRRIGKRIDADGNGSYETAERYVYDGDSIVLVYNDAGVLQARYLQGEGIDQVLAEEMAGQTKWMLADHQGSVRDMVNNAGTLSGHVLYNGFGIALTGTPGRFGFTGREYDAESGLYHYRRRYYDPGLGRFINQDPIGFDGGDSNLYRYVSNSPTNFVDPTGLAAVNNGGAWNSIGAAGVGSWFGGNLMPQTAPSVTVVHRAAEASAFNILKEGFKPGRDGLSWFSTPITGNVGGAKVAASPVVLTVEARAVPLHAVSMNTMSVYMKQTSDIAKGLKLDSNHFWDLLWDRVRGDGGSQARLGLLREVEGGKHYAYTPEGLAQAKPTVVGATGSPAVQTALEPVIWWRNAGKTVQRVLQRDGTSAGRVLMTYAAVNDGLAIYRSDDRVTTTQQKAGAWGGAWLGAKGGGATGLALGGMTGPAAPVAAPVLGFVGAVGGSILGYWGGEKLITAMQSSSSEIRLKRASLYPVRTYDCHGLAPEVPLPPFWQQSPEEAARADAVQKQILSVHRKQTPATQPTRVYHPEAPPLP